MGSRPRAEAASDRCAIIFERPEYGALANEFGRLAGAFGHAIDGRLLHDIARLTSAIECIDRWVDTAPSDSERMARWQLTVDGLRRTRADARPSSGRRELRRAVEDLRELAEERGVLDRIRRIVAKESQTSEALRGARDGGTFLSHVEREGRLTAALALVIAGGACGRAFRRFFFRLGPPANIVDKILDCRGDHARGETSLPPSAALYARLFGALVLRGAALIVSCRRPVVVVRLGLRYLIRGAT